MMCYQCGKREARIEGLCEPCFLEAQPPLFIKNVKVPMCRECGAFHFKTWRDVPLEAIVREYINREDTDFSVQKHNSVYSVSVVVRQKFHKDQTHPLVQQAHFSVYVKDSLCNQCSKMLSGYYQAVLQVRRQDHVLTEEEREACLAVVTDSLGKEDFISRIEDKKEGTDFYFSSTKAARKAAGTLKKRFGGVIRDSYKLVGFDRQTFTDVKRGTILFSLYRYKKGDIVRIKDSVYEVTSSVHKFHIRNAEEEKILPWKKVEYLEEENGISVLPPSDYEIVVCQILDVTPSSVLILRPDFTTVYLERPKSIKVEVGKDYRILVFQERAHWM